MGSRTTEFRTELAGPVRQAMPMQARQYGTRCRQISYVKRYRHSVPSPRAGVKQPDRPLDGRLDGRLRPLKVRRNPRRSIHDPVQRTLSAHRGVWQPVRHNANSARLLR